jgi:hypothetical protein
VIDEDAADDVRPHDPGPGALPPVRPTSIGATLETEERKPRRWRLFRKGDD